jgi:hypothetical protein
MARYDVGAIKEARMSKPIPARVLNAIFNPEAQAAGTWLPSWRESLATFALVFALVFVGFSVVPA